MVGGPDPFGGPSDEVEGDETVLLYDERTRRERRKAGLAPRRRRRFRLPRFLRPVLEAPRALGELAPGDPVRVLSDRWRGEGVHRHNAEGHGTVSRIVPEGCGLPAGTIMVRFPENPDGHYPYSPEQVEPRAGAAANE